MKLPPSQQPRISCAERPLLFLDFDGVLHPAHGRAIPANQAGIWRGIGKTFFLPLQVNHVRSLCESTGAGIVIISSWLLLGYPRTFYDGILGGHVAGQVREPDSRPLHERREAAILAYLEKQGRGVPFVVVDDQPDQYVCLRDHLVTTDPQQGITDREADLARDIFQGKGRQNR